MRTIDAGSQEKDLRHKWYVKMKAREARARGRLNDQLKQQRQDRKERKLREAEEDCREEGEAAGREVVDDQEGVSRAGHTCACEPGPSS